jgi:hypothetical protein
MKKVWLFFSGCFMLIGISMFTGGLVADLEVQCLVSSSVDGGEEEFGLIWCTRRKDSTCVTGSPCTGYHETTLCKLVGGVVEGSCFKCNAAGTGTADFCVASPNKTCLVSDRIGGLPTVNCGTPNGASCVANPTGPFGATCDSTQGGTVSNQACSRLKQCE